MTRFPYPVGSQVAGVGFSGKVTATPGPYSVVVNGKLIVPNSLIQTPAAPAPRTSIDSDIEDCLE
jgi:hypothetical protein